MEHAAKLDNRDRQTGRNTYHDMKITCTQKFHVIILRSTNAATNSTQLKLR